MSKKKGVSWWQWCLLVLLALMTLGGWIQFGSLVVSVDDPEDIIATVLPAVLALTGGLIYAVWRLVAQRKI